ncbi:MAG TPA: uracil-DNA glycosylase [bacterium]|nr:uracil-DNA glycosylase [bacterium]
MEAKRKARALAENLKALGVKEIATELPASDILERLGEADTAQEREMSRRETLRNEAAVVEKCKKCGLGGHRTHAVYGDGNEYADIVFVGEAPGAEEDRQGLPFVGRAGQLLNRLLEQVGLTRSEIYICNLLKCRPPDNRDPLPEELAACRPYLDRQTAVIKPKIIVCLGLFAAQAMLNAKESMARLRGGQHKIGDTFVIPTYHTAAALRFPAYKQQIYDDLCRARDLAYG